MLNQTTVKFLTDPQTISIINKTLNEMGLANVRLFKPTAYKADAELSFLVEIGSKEEIDLLELIGIAKTIAEKLACKMVVIFTNDMLEEKYKPKQDMIVEYTVDNIANIKKFIYTEFQTSSSAFFSSQKRKASADEKALAISSKILTKIQEDEPLYKLIKENPALIDDIFAQLKDGLYKALTSNLS